MRTLLCLQIFVKEKGVCFSVTVLCVNLFSRSMHSSMVLLLRHVSEVSVVLADHCEGEGRLLQCDIPIHQGQAQAPL